MICIKRNEGVVNCDIILLLRKKVVCYMKILLKTKVKNPHKLSWLIKRNVTRRLKCTLLNALGMDESV